MMPHTKMELRSMGMSSLVDAFPNGTDFSNCIYLDDRAYGAEGECDVLCLLGIVDRCPATFDTYLALQGYDSKATLRLGHKR
jgi:hypothetical protein